MKKLLVFSTATLLSIVSFSQTDNTSKDSLYIGFQTPPNSAKPRVWWHWMNGNITKDGIQKDLEWMHRAGIGGFQNFDAALATPQIVPKRLTYMTPEWKRPFFSLQSLPIHCIWKWQLQDRRAGAKVVVRG